MTQKQKSYTSAELKKLDGSLLEITGSIPTEAWEKYRAKALQEINNSVSIDGFRAGMVPENILIAKVGEMSILERMAEFALSHAYADIIIENDIDAIGRPNIQITKLAKDNPIEFKLTTAVLPEIKLADYKKIANTENKKQNEGEGKFTDEELDSTIKRIQTAGTKENTDPLPPLTDDLVKTWGEFSSVADFKEKVGKMLSQQKIDQAREKRRIQMCDAIIEGSDLQLPEILVNSELARIEANFQADLERMKVTVEDYVKHSKKSLEEIRKEWRPHAEKKAKLQLILSAIAKKENIKPSQEEIDHEVKHILEHYKDADIERAADHAETVITNEKVFEFLEKSTA